MTDINITEAAGYSETFDALWEHCRNSNDPDIAVIAVLNAACAIALSTFGPKRAAQSLRLSADEIEARFGQLQ